MPCLPSEWMINYKFIEHGSAQSYDTTITLNSLQQQRESARDLRERMGGSYAPAEKTASRFRCPLVASPSALAKKNHGKTVKKKFCLDSKQSCLQNNAHWPSVSPLLLPSTWELANRSYSAWACCVGSQ